MKMDILNAKSVQDPIKTPSKTLQPSPNLI